MHVNPVSTALQAELVKPQFNRYLLGCTLVAALGGLLFGFDTAVISGTVDALRAKFTLSDGLLGFTVASALIVSENSTVYVNYTGAPLLAAGTYSDTLTVTMNLN